MPKYMERTGFDDPNDPIEREVIRGVDAIERYLGGQVLPETLPTGPEGPSVDVRQLAYNGLLPQIPRQRDERAEYRNAFDPFAGNYYLG